MKYEAVIGLEIHCELKTKTKIFCGCATGFGAEQNTHVCPVCLGLPGVLPTINKSVVEFAINLDSLRIAHQAQGGNRTTLLPKLQALAA